MVFTPLTPLTHNYDFRESFSYLETLCYVSWCNYRGANEMADFVIDPGPQMNPVKGKQPTTFHVCVIAEIVIRY
jgi:hypothetical protein